MKAIKPSFDKAMKRQPPDHLSSLNGGTFEGIVRSLREDRACRVLALLRQVPAFVGVVKNLREGQTYRAVFTQSELAALGRGVARLGKRGENFSANIHGEGGKIVGQAKLAKMPPDLLPSLSQLCLQQSISEVLDRLVALECKLNEVLIGMHNDRLALVQSAEQLCEQALLARAWENRRLLLMLSISHAIEGREKLLLTMRADMQALMALVKDTPDGLVMDVIKAIGSNSREGEIRGKAETVQQALLGALRATKVLLVCYEELNEPGSLALSLQPLHGMVKELSKQGESIARLLPYDPASPPEKLWRELPRALEQKIWERTKQLGTEKVLELEFHRKELIGGTSNDR